MGDGVYKRFRLICDCFRVSSPRWSGFSGIRVIRWFLVSLLTIKASLNEWKFRKENLPFSTKWLELNVVRILDISFFPLLILAIKVSLKLLWKFASNRRTINNFDDVKATLNGRKLILTIIKNHEIAIKKLIIPAINSCEESRENK